MLSKNSAVRMVATIGILACFIPINKSPTVGSTLWIEVARGAAVGILAPYVLIGLFAKKRLESQPMQVAIAAVIVVGLSIYRVFALSSHRMPTFEGDDPGAVPFYQSVCDQGETAWCTLLGTCYWTGTCRVERDRPRAVELFQCACDGGPMSACGQLAVCYELGGCGFSANGWRAVALYEKACDGADVGVCSNLGICYNKGQCGLSQDDVRASELYGKACQGGDSAGYHNLEVMNSNRR